MKPIFIRRGCYRIIPKIFTQQVTIPKFALETLVKEASIFNQEIVIDISNNKIKLTDFDGVTEIEDEFISNATMKFGVNAKLILNFLTSFNEENIQICFNQSNQPIMLVANQDYKEIIMPIVIPIIEEENEEIQNAA